MTILLSSINLFFPSSQSDFKPFYILARVKMWIYIYKWALQLSRVKFSFTKTSLKYDNILDNKDVSFHKTLLLSECCKCNLIHVQLKRVLINNSKSKALFQYAVGHHVLMRGIFVGSNICFPKTIKSCIYL